MNFIDFTNNRFQVLCFLYEICNSDYVAHITQQEIANKLEMSRSTINKIMSYLVKEQYICTVNAHVGRYILTSKAVLLVQGFKNI